MKQLLITIALCIGCFTAVDAQSTFTERLQKSNKGEGKISVTQDKSIDALVNGSSAVTKQPENNKPEQKDKVTTPKDKADNKEKAESKDKEKVAPKDNESQAIVVAPDTADVHKKVMKGLKAERTGESIKVSFPGEPVYVHFYSPRWICRMGNYRTYEEAHEVLQRVKQLGYDSAIIVKGKITVQYP